MTTSETSDGTSDSPIPVVRFLGSCVETSDERRATYRESLRLSLLFLIRSLVAGRSLFPQVSEMTRATSDRRATCHQSLARHSRGSAWKVASQDVPLSDS